MSLLQEGKSVSCRMGAIIADTEPFRMSIWLLPTQTSLATFVLRHASSSYARAAP